MVFTSERNSICLFLNGSKCIHKFVKKKKEKSESDVKHCKISLEVLSAVKGFLNVISNKIQEIATTEEKKK